MGLWQFEIDDAAQLGRLREKLEDDAAYSVLMDSLKELKAIVEEAKGQGCNLYGSRLKRPSFVILMYFQNEEGAELATKISFTEAYRRQAGKPLSYSTACALQSAVLTLVLNAGMGALRRRRRR
jgi:hypothetical protein